MIIYKLIDERPINWKKEVIISREQIEYMNDRIRDKKVTGVVMGLVVVGADKAAKGDEQW